MNSTMRLLQLQRREDFLLNKAQEMVYPYKLNRQAFAYENLWENYRSKSRRLKRIQYLTRRTTQEARRHIESILDKQ